jgi:GGDEF domain-containing protein
MQAVLTTDVSLAVGSYLDTGIDPLVTDQVTGLGLRGKLLADLAEAVAAGSAPAVLAIFALDGFKEYEELYGVLEARKLLRRLADRLAGAFDGQGCCYRPRGDEFAVLVERPASVSGVLASSLAALSENDRYYHVEAAGGHAVLPSEASDPIEALMVADRRLTANAPRRGPRR